MLLKHFTKLHIYCILLSKGGEIMSNETEKKPIYKKWWFWLIIVVIVIGVGASQTGSNNTVTTGSPTNTIQATSQAEQEENAVPKEYQNALEKAKTYSDTMNMSKAGIYDQLTSEYGEQFSKDAAQYAIDNLDADWKANALAKAKTYQDTMNMSKNAIYDQLISEYGEKFTKEEAQYAIDNLE